MKTWMKFVGGLVAAVGGVGVAAVLVAAKGVEEPKPVEQVLPTVQVVPLEREIAPARVWTTGTVEAARQVVIQPEVSGRVVDQAAQLHVGGRFNKGDTLARLDARDYQSAVEQAESQVAQAELNLALEQGRGAVAEREMQLVGSSEQQDLVLRKPHLHSSEQALEAAEAQLAQARNNLGRTRLTAPFDAVVLAEGIDVGQVIQPGAQAVTLAGTDAFYVQTSVPVDQLALLQVPGATARVTQDVGDGQLQRQGTVVSLGGEVDRQTRTATVLVEVQDPLEGPGLPLLLGSFVDVELQGVAVDEAVGVPRQALHEGREVWVVTDDNTLAVRPVTVRWSTPDAVWVAGDFAAGDRAITSSVQYPIEGMTLQVGE
jgi:RND family efflux transporter MFP subunit